MKKICWRAKIHVVISRKEGTEKMVWRILQEVVLKRPFDYKNDRIV